MSSSSHFGTHTPKLAMKLVLACHTFSKNLATLGNIADRCCANSSSCVCREIIGDVTKDLDRMRNAVVHLRSLTHPDRPAHSIIQLNDTILEVLRLLSREAERRGIQVQSKLDPGLPEMNGDPVQLSQVVLNLLRNAFDACEGCPEPRRSVVVETQTFDECSIQLVIRDSGKGMSDEVLGQLFQPFFTTKESGMGMGLRLSQTIVRAHGGTIEGSSHPHRQGAAFLVKLPSQSAPCCTKV